MLPHGSIPYIRTWTSLKSLIGNGFTELKWGFNKLPQEWGPLSGFQLRRKQKITRRILVWRGGEKAELALSAMGGSTGSSINTKV